MEGSYSSGINEQTEGNIAYVVMAKLIKEDTEVVLIKSDGETEIHNIINKRIVCVKTSCH